MLSNLIALVAIYQWFGQMFQEKVDELENDYMENIYGEYNINIDMLQQQLDLERQAKYDYFTKELEKSDLPLSEKRYYKGQQDMLDKIKEIN